METTKRMECVLSDDKQALIDRLAKLVSSKNFDKRRFINAMKDINLVVDLLSNRSSIVTHADVTSDGFRFEIVTNTEFRFMTTPMLKRFIRLIESDEY
jgi:hypothetical protein